MLIGQLSDMINKKKRKGGKKPKFYEFGIILGSVKSGILLFQWYFRSSVITERTRKNFTILVLGPAADQKKENIQVVVVGGEGEGE